MLRSGYLAHASVFALLILLSVPRAYGWGNNKNSNTDATAYGDTFSRDWLYDGSAISMKLEGCVWSPVQDAEEAACMEESSEDGTTYWYQMANCKRANAAFSFYASSGSNAGCNNGNFKETMVSSGGLPEFLYTLQTYDANSPFSGDDQSDDSAYAGWGLNELPMCESTESGYLGLACGNDGSFIIAYFNDAYCLSPSGTYDSLNSLNKKLKHYTSCSSIYSNGDDYNAAEQLIPYSESCSNLDSSLCTNDSAMSSHLGSTSRTSGVARSARVTYHKSWMTKLKYGTAGVLLLASFIMFTGILFTNRRRRRALMARRARHSRTRDDKSRKSSSKSTRSKSRDGKSVRSGKSRSSSRRRSKSRTGEKEGDGGVLT